MLKPLILLLALMLGVVVEACPWCKTNALQKVTVFPETPDPGGKIFGRVPDPAKVRRYYIAAEPVNWDYIPTRQDPVSHNPLPPALVAHPESPKLRFVEYTDASFAVKSSQPAHLGILGPVMRARVGEYIQVTFLNKSERPLSMHPHGLKYDKDNEGSSYYPNPGLGAAIAPGARFTYVWEADENSGPLASEPSSKAWLYHSHVLGDEEMNLGLFGFIIVTDPKRARQDGTPVDVDRELSALLMIFDDSAREAEEAPNSRSEIKGLPDRVLVHRVREYFSGVSDRKANMHHTINGLSYGNLNGLEMREGERVRWYVFALGSEDGLHTIHWHGARVVQNGNRRTDTLELLPATMTVADMPADNPGDWLVHCHVADHMMEGMYAPFTILPKDSPKVLQPAFYALKSANRALRVEKLSGELARANGASATARLNFAAQWTVPNIPRFEGANIGVRFGGQEWAFRLDSQAKAREEGGTAALRIVKTGGALGVTLGLSLNLEGPKVTGALSGLKMGSNSELPLSIHFNDRELDGALEIRPVAENSGRLTLKSGLE